MNKTRGDLIAKICDVSPVTVRKWYRNDSVPKAYGVLINHVLDGQIYTLGAFNGYKICADRIYDSTGSQFIEKDEICKMWINRQIIEIVLRRRNDSKEKIVLFKSNIKNVDL